MTNESNGLRFVQRAVEDWEWPTLEYPHPMRDTLVMIVRGIIGNWVPTTERGKRIAREWRLSVAAAVEAARGGAPWNDAAVYAISLGFRFHPGTHWNQPLDVENFIKPTVDALAKGLGMPWLKRGEWDYDDSRFGTLLAHRCPEADTPEEEGVAIAVSCPERSTS